MSAYTFLGAAISLGVVGQLLLKLGMARYPRFEARQILRLTRDVAVLGGFGLYGLSVLLYFNALATLDLSVAYPSVSLGYVLTVILARLVFKESVSAMRWLAIVVICVGVVLVGLGTG